MLSEEGEPPPVKGGLSPPRAASTGDQMSLERHVHRQSGWETGQAGRTVTPSCHRGKPELRVCSLLNFETVSLSRGPRECWGCCRIGLLLPRTQQPLPGGQDWPPGPDYSEQWPSWWCAAQLLLRLVIFTLWSLPWAVLTHSPEALGVLTTQLLFNTPISMSALSVHAGLRRGERLLVPGNAQDQISLKTQ